MSEREHKRIDHSKGWRCGRCGDYVHLTGCNLPDRLAVLDRMWDLHTTSPARTGDSLAAPFTPET